MTQIERLLGIEEIKLLRHRWSRYVDEGSWGKIAELLAPDAELDLSATRRKALSPDAEPLPPVRGAEAICRWLEDAMGSMPDQLHVVTMPEITFRSDDEAEAIWRQQSFLPNARGLDGRVGLGFGTIRDSYVRIEGRWLIRTMGVTVDLVL